MSSITATEAVETPVFESKIQSVFTVLEDNKDTGLSLTEIGSAVLAKYGVELTNATIAREIRRLRKEGHVIVISQRGNTADGRRVFAYTYSWKTASTHGFTL